MPVSGPQIPLQNSSLVESIFQNLKETGKNTFLIDAGKDKEYSYAELSKNASSIAVSLQKMGVTERTMVATLAENSFETFSFALGIFFSKGIVCPINYILKADEIKIMLEITKAKIIYADEKYIKLAEEAINNIGFDIKIITNSNNSKYENYSNLINEDISKFEIKILNPDKHVVANYFTSGTTGIPKGVMIRDQAIYNNCYWCWSTSETKMLITSPMFWITNLLILTKCMNYNRTVVIPGEVNAENVAKCITKTKPEGWLTGGAILLEMCQLPNINEYSFSSLTYIFVTGSTLIKKQKQIVVEKLLNGKHILKNILGSTETGVITMYPKPISIESPKYNSIGLITAGAVLKIVDISSGKELGPHQQGEICVKTATMMAGYICEDIEDNYDEEGWWHMGDIGYYDEDGYLYYVSRLKDLIKYRGLQIAPAELEQILVKHPGVYEASVVGKPHDIDGEWPSAFIIKKDLSLTSKELEEFVSGHVPDCKRLRGGVHFVKDFPRSPVGKILKTELVKMLI